MLICPGADLSFKQSADLSRCRFVLHPTETWNLCVIKVILLACFTYIDIFIFIKSLLTY
jgi:hypothetical protein